MRSQCSECDREYPTTNEPGKTPTWEWFPPKFIPFLNPPFICDELHACITYHAALFIAASLLFHSQIGVIYLPEMLTFAALASSSSSSSSSSSPCRNVFEIIHVAAPATPLKSDRALKWRWPRLTFLWLASGHEEGAGAGRKWRHPPPDTASSHPIGNRFITSLIIRPLFHPTPTPRRRTSAGGHFVQSFAYARVWTSLHADTVLTTFPTWLT